MGGAKQQLQLAMRALRQLEGTLQALDRILQRGRRGISGHALEQVKPTQVPLGSLTSFGLTGRVSSSPVQQLAPLRGMPTMANPVQSPFLSLLLGKVIQQHYSSTSGPAVHWKLAEEEEEEAAEATAAELETAARGAAPPEQPVLDPDGRDYYHTVKHEEICFVLEKAHGKDVEAMYVRDRCNYTDWQVVVTGRSQRHIRAMADAVVNMLKTRCREVIEGLPPGVEGRDSKDWMAVDAGNVIVHLFTEEARLHYNLEGLWRGDKPPS